MRIGIAGFTNLSRDHLDYHGTIDAYLEAKMILFERLVAADGTAVIAADNEFAAEVANAATAARPCASSTVGTEARAGYPPSSIARSRDLPSVSRSRMAAGPIGCGCRWSARFQVENALVAAGQAIAAATTPRPCSPRSKG